MPNACYKYLFLTAHTALAFKQPCRMNTPTTCAVTRPEFLFQVTKVKGRGSHRVNNEATLTDILLDDQHAAWLQSRFAPLQQSKQIICNRGEVLHTQLQMLVIIRQTVECSQQRQQDTITSSSSWRRMQEGAHHQSNTGAPTGTRSDHTCPTTETSQLMPHTLLHCMRENTYSYNRPQCALNHPRHSTLKTSKSKRVRFRSCLP